MRHRRRNTVSGVASEPAYDVSIPDTLLDGLDCCDPAEWAVSADAPELVSLIASVRAPAQPHELRGEAAAVAAFREAARRASAQPRMRLHARHGSRKTKLVAAALVGSVSLGTVAAAAAVEGNLPAPLQEIAHALFGLPSPDSDKDSTGVEHRERPTDGRQISDQKVAQQTPHESVQDILVTSPDPSVPAVVIDDMFKQRDAELDEPEADSPTQTAPASADDPPGVPESGAQSAPPPGEPPPGAADAGGPPPAGGPSHRQPPHAEVLPVTPPAAGAPPAARPPVGAGQPPGTGQPQGTGPPTSAGAPAAVEPPAPEPQPAGGPPARSAGPPASAPDSPAQPPGKP